LWGLPGGDGSGELRSCLLARPEDAMRNGADAVLTYLAVGTGDSDFETKEVARNAEVARECERIGMPLIIETLARGKNVKSPSAPMWLKLHTRMAAELGADLVKTDYAGDPPSMRDVVENCPIPILVLGGSRYSSDAEALKLIHGVVAAGAAGSVLRTKCISSGRHGCILAKRSRCIGEKQAVSCPGRMKAASARSGHVSIRRVASVLDGRSGYRLRAPWGPCFRAGRRRPHLRVESE
jgi:2-amino-4,5-dihydroxy-6-oxo-7-(phosphonooxy)heptanoate synthase